MPKSRRNKVVALTKTEKKGKDAKSILFEKVRKAADANTHCYVISVSNMRNSMLKAMRMGLKDADGTTFFFGNNKVTAKALGGPEREHEYKDGLRFVGQALKGDVGLCFSGMDVDQIRDSFSKYVVMDFARNGVVATHTVTLPAGPVMRRVEAAEIDTIDESLAPSYLSESKDEIMAFPNNMETQLRGLGMPTLLKGGVIVLMRDFTICTEGQQLTPAQAQLLKHFNLKMAKFNVRIIGHWTEAAGYENVDGAVDGGDEKAEDMEDDE
ncbi:mRNA turnover 4 [Chytriomyces hyalinus]|nr:mRNA turnover 4 [Chytriomyces hyalinus]KAJ3262784.1 mRNA turnover 4 [Chytriomyces hyalinus]